AEAAQQRARTAKTHNVTIALRCATATLCSDAADRKRLAKDCDSAWLRYALAVPDLAGGDDSTRIFGDAVIVLLAVDGPASGADAHRRLVDDAARLAEARGFRVVDAGAETLAAAVAALRS
ncbi:MAG: hypothetical protein ACREM6_09115, partial [Vulcanimicrobiaceae bacterium]